jgi:ATP-dependent DNA helicase RecG
MRPTILNPLFAPITALPGIGPKQDALYRRLLHSPAAAGPRILDLLLHLPTGIVDRRARPKLRDVIPGSVATVAVVIDRHRPPPGGGPGRRMSRAPHLVYAHDDTADLVLTYFKAFPGSLERQLPVGALRYVSGRIETYDGVLQMVHPERVVDEAGLATLPPIDPVYPLTEGLGLGSLRKAVEAALDRVPPLPEWQDEAFIAQQGWPDFAAALRAVHRPLSPQDAMPGSAAWSRLAYDELLAGQLALALTRAHLRRPAGRRRAGSGRLRERVISALPYALTASQRRAMVEIVADLGKPQRMLRLLQGDVGSGKTVVALLAAAEAIEAGSQGALMAPTELLARQHWSTIAPLAESVGIRAGFLSGRERGRERADLLDRLADGSIDLAIGTHALFQDEVAFRELGLAVVDEQHRFGVHQRLALARKGEAVDMLVMTATPIPRTLVLTCFGDMDASELREKPAGRQPVDTRTVPLGRLPDVVSAVGRALAAGDQVYWVCPLVEDSQSVDLAAAQQRFEALRQRFGDTVDLVHGRLKGAEKDAAMEGFATGRTRLLVATTVIEVGVDVPEAGVMVIEHAERFGLAQLHQLRGRIGRGIKPATCLLVFKPPLGETAKRRLSVMRETQDGFRIAEEDLRLRGEGDVLGTRQSGLPAFRTARIDAHGGLIEIARKDAALVLARDPELATARGAALRHLLYLFGRDEAIRLLRAG